MMTTFSPHQILIDEDGIEYIKVEGVLTASGLTEDGLAEIIQDLGIPVNVTDKSVSLSRFHAEALVEAVTA